MKKILLVLLVISLKSFDAQEHDVSGRLMMMDKHMRRLNLTDIHFTDPNGLVKVDTVLNVFNSSKEDLYKRMMKKLNDSAHDLANSSPQELEEWKKKIVKLPRPVHSSQIRKKTGGQKRG